MSKHFSTSYNPWWKRKDYDDYYDDEDDGVGVYLENPINHLSEILES